MKLNLHEILPTGRERAANKLMPKTPWERLLVPVDFTDSSREALKLAVSLVADPEDRLTLLHVVEPPHFRMSGLADVLIAKSDATVVAEAEERLKRWARQEAGPDLKVETLVRIGRVHREILRVAETRHCDAIVIAHQPKNWCERLLPGSVTRKLARQAPCAVITLPPAEQRQRIPVQFSPVQAWQAGLDRAPEIPKPNPS